MEIYTTTQGRIVIPAALRRKYGIRAGTRIQLFDDGENILLKPAAKQSAPRLQGVLKGRGTLKILLQERARDTEREG